MFIRLLEKFLDFSYFSLSSYSAFLNLAMWASFSADGFVLDYWDLVLKWMLGPPLLAVRLFSV
jgi:uncharacterized membrane protein AbrB (regulator of aidB expression)